MDGTSGSPICGNQVIMPNPFGLELPLLDPNRRINLECDGSDVSPIRVEQRRLQFTFAWETRIITDARATKLKHPAVPQGFQAG